MGSLVEGGALLGRALKRSGVEAAFYLPGGATQQLIWELYRQGVTLIEVRHEQAAAMMAHAYSRVTGKVGVCVTGAGIETINAASGIVMALDDAVPLLAIGGSVATGTRGMGTFQEMEQVPIMATMTKRAWQIPSAKSIPRLVTMAIAEACGGKHGPVYLDLPDDIALAMVDEDSLEQFVVPSAPARARGDQKGIEQAVEILARAERPVLIAGSGAVWSDAGPEIKQLVECAGLPFYTTPSAKGLVTEDHQLSFPAARSFAWKNADAILSIGTRANWIVQHLSPPRFAADAKLIVVNVDPTEIDHNRHADVGIVGDAKAVALQLVDEVRRRFSSNTTGWLALLRDVNGKNEARQQEYLNSNEKPIHPLRLCKEIRDFLRRDAILVTDGNEVMSFARQSIPAYYPRLRLTPGVSGFIGAGVPFGVGAKVAYPHKQVLVLTGDGSFGLNGMEMDTAVRHRANIVTVVGNNGGWAGVDEGEAPRWPAGRLGFTRYDKIVEALGGWGRHIEEPDEIRPALEEAFGCGKPALLNVVVKPQKASVVNYSTLGQQI